MRKPASHQRQTFSSQRYDRAGSAPVIKVRDELDALCDRGSWLIPSPFLASLAQFGDEQHEQWAAKSVSPPRVFLDHLLGGMRFGKAGDYESGLA